MTAPTILVVDDEHLITDFVSDLLTDEGYTVRVAHDGASALLAIRADPPHLVMLEVAMPVMTGEEVLRELRANDFPDLPIIVATAGMHPERFLSQGATDVLSQPFDVTQLLALVSHRLDNGTDTA